MAGFFAPGQSQGQTPYQLAPPQAIDNLGESFQSAN